MPTSAEIVEAIPVILSLIMIEGLLSVDNSLAIAAMARRVAPEQRQRALNWGMAGAYGFRCICLVFAAVIIQYAWIKILGAAYLVYLMCAELTHDKDGDGHGDAAEPEAETKPAEPGLPATAGGELPLIPERKEALAGNPPDSGPPVEYRTFASVVTGILILDASLSVDNVIAALALTDKLWAVYAGVGIGILSLRLLAGWCMRMITKFPILEQTAFLLVGYVGFILLFEMYTKVHLGPFYKFIGIVGITTTCLYYERSEGVRKALAPIIAVFRPIMYWFATVCGWIFWPFKFAIGKMTGG